MFHSLRTSLPEHLRSLAVSTRRHPVVGSILVLVALVSIVLTLRLSAFMWSADHRHLALVPDNDFLTKHSCLSSYAVGAALFADRDPNIYDTAHYHAETADHGMQIGSFDQDPFQYPPTILVPFSAMLSLTRDFGTLRWWWYLIESVIILYGLFHVAGWLGGGRATRIAAMLVVPLVWGSMPNLMALQFGNIQVVVLALAILGMIAFERNRVSLGGALLSFAILAKIFPGVLVIYLLARRQWREVVAVASWGMAFVVLTLAVGGISPWLQFVVYQLPRLASGEAFADVFVQMPVSAIFSLSYALLPHKLDALGLIHAPGVSRLAGSLGTLLVVIAAVVLGFSQHRRQLAGGQGGHSPRIQLVLGWLALLNLATLQATMSPHYAVVGTFWLLTLWAAGRPSEQVVRTSCWVAFAFLVLLTASPNPALILLSQLTNIAINLAIVITQIGPKEQHLVVADGAQLA